MKSLDIAAKGIFYISILHDIVACFTSMCLVGTGMLWRFFTLEIHKASGKGMGPEKPNLFLQHILHYSTPLAWEVLRSLICKSKYFLLNHKLLM